MLDAYGVDSQPNSPGHRGQRGDRNSPTVLNAALHTAQFWDGRAPDVEAQAKGPVLNPIEMAMPSEEAVVATLASIPGYQEQFKEAFPESGITYDNMATAIGAFSIALGVVALRSNTSRRLAAAADHAYARYAAVALAGWRGRWHAASGPARAP